MMSGSRSRYCLYLLGRAVGGRVALVVAVEAVVFASISVGPSPRRARSIASPAAANIGERIEAVDDHAGDVVALRARSATSFTEQW